MSAKIISQLTQLFKSFTGSDAKSITPLPESGSDRKYFRFTSYGKSLIGAYNPDIDENSAFFYLTQHFHDQGFPVAELLAISDDKTCYLLTDLGNETLLNILEGADWSEEKSVDLRELVKETLKTLAKIQISGAKGLDFSRCYPKSEFDLQCVMWDFNYFKYSFLKPSGVRFNELKLENDFLAFAKILLAHNKEFFHYRDFQSRNIMLVNRKPYLIDYQGGRKGPLLYDVASFLYQAKANIPAKVRNQMLDYYINAVKELIPVDAQKLKIEFPNFALFRLIQTLGAYGFRGFFERKPHFLQSIPYAANNIADLLPLVTVDIPHLQAVLAEVSSKYSYQPKHNPDNKDLTVEITSFSYKKGYPLGHPVHGGGFVFDCRGLPNPGRLTEFKTLTGNDAPVANFLNNSIEANQFFEKVSQMVNQSIEVYTAREFGYLAVSFGCTGGQHRSVYMANRLAKHLFQNKKLGVIVKHRELDK